MSAQILQEALSAQEQYQRELQRILDHVDDLEEESARRILDLLADARRSILGMLEDIPADDYLASFLPRIEREIGQAMRRYGDRYAAYFDEHAREVWQLGVSSVDAPLASAGSNLMVQLPALEPRLLDIMSDFRASLITGVEDAAIGAMTREIQLGVLGKAFPDVRKEIADVLRTQPNAAGSFGSIAARADAIHRTETNRLFSMATQSRQSEFQQRVQAVFPELTPRKRWLNAGDNRVRPSHRRQALLDQRPAVDEDFILVDGAGQAWHATGPHDARLPASQSTNCRCRSIISVDSIMSVLEAV